MYLDLDFFLAILVICHRSVLDVFAFVNNIGGK